MTRRKRSVMVGVGLAMLVVVALLTGCGVASAPASTTAPTSRSATDPETGLPWADLEQLPSQVSDTLKLIDRGGPYPNRQDGVVFGNRERILPKQPSGFYHEYTVVTPGSADRGARRVVTGDADRQFFYTDDHYASFVRIRR